MHEGDRGSVRGAQLHPNGTAIEGEWEPVFAAIEACHLAVHAMGCPRECGGAGLSADTRLTLLSRRAPGRLAGGRS